MRKSHKQKEKYISRCSFDKCSALRKDVTAHTRSAASVCVGIDLPGSKLSGPDAGPRDVKQLRRRKRHVCERVCEIRSTFPFFLRLQENRKKKNS